jgi:hypothetical protein
VCCRGLPYADRGECHTACTRRSDRGTKHAVEGVDGDALLVRLAALPITTWSYRDDPTGARHIGPMAQDFEAAFGLGSDGRTIDLGDAVAIALASVQALNVRVDQLQAENARLRAALAASK